LQLQEEALATGFESLLADIPDLTGILAAFTGSVVKCRPITGFTGIPEASMPSGSGKGEGRIRENALSRFIQTQIGAVKGCWLLACYGNIRFSS
jgi:hypothetical protein